MINFGLKTILARILLAAHFVNVLHYFWPKHKFAAFPFVSVVLFFFFFSGPIGPDRMGLLAPSDGSLTTPKGVITRRLMRTRV